MKRLIILAPTIALIAIAAGCSRGPDQLQPGQWEKVTEIKTLELTGAPPEAQARIRSQIGRSVTTQECITAEQARNPLQQMREMARSQAANCRFSEETFGGGVIRIRATCGGAGQGGTGTVSVEGTFTGTDMHATMSVSGQGAASAAMPGVTGMNMTAEVRGRRIGDCPAGAARPGNGL